MSVKKSTESYGELFVPMHDVSEKRKNLLLSIKNSLVMQEEYEKVLMIRAKKAEILKTIKKGMSSLNTDYLKIKKHFPNVKNVLSNTEKEISILESQISMLKNSNVKNTDDILKKIETEKILEEKLLGKQQATIPKVKHVKAHRKAPTKVIKAKPVPVIAIKKPLTKKERVRANLKSIESKLNSL